jgi:hypothetical protein
MVCVSQSRCLRSVVAAVGTVAGKPMLGHQLLVDAMRRSGTIVLEPELQTVHQKLF